MRELTFTEAAREGLAEEMERDPSVFVVGEGIGARGGNFATSSRRGSSDSLPTTPAGTLRSISDVMRSPISRMNAPLCRTSP